VVTAFWSNTTPTFDKEPEIFAPNLHFFTNFREIEK